MSEIIEKMKKALEIVEALEGEEESENKDSWEFGKASNRKKLYLDFDDPELVKRKIDNAIGADEYRKTLISLGKEDDEELSEMERKRIERLDNFLEEATISKEDDEDSSEGE